MMKITMTGFSALLGLAALANPPAAPVVTAREAFLKNQAFEEVQRVSGQVDMLESNQAALAERVRKLENGGDLRAVKADVEALRSDINRLRQEMQAQRREIVNDILEKIKRAQPAPVRLPPAAPREPTGKYVVQPGDTLSMIAQAFNTTVGKLKDMNGLKGDGLRVGQTLQVPDPNGRR